MAFVSAVPLLVPNSSPFAVDCIEITILFFIHKEDVLNDGKGVEKGNPPTQLVGM